MTEAEQPATEPDETATAWIQVQSLPCQLTVALPVSGFRARDVMSMGPQTVIPVDWRVGSDLPLLVNGELIAWGELEVAGERLLLRVTELA
jgi:flagellar motor switch protein FliN